LGGELLTGPDTTISWYNLAEPNPLAYVITGDMGNEWLRDSSHQMVPYLPLLPYDKNLQALFRAVLNLQGQYIADKPYCNAFQPPPASGLKPNSVASNIAITPAIDSTVYQCKWEIDSLASFLRLSWGYWEVTNDATFMTTNWKNAVNQIMTVLQEQSLPTVQADGTPNPISYSYQPTGSRAVLYQCFTNLIVDGSINSRRIRFTVGTRWTHSIFLPSLG
jgi:uncharacterized protein